jgi:hypothetical protein|tara:strand:+ start:459 stop:581 length:123 start_codon:yes stop_codon:yes gene_type:complete
MYKLNPQQVSQRQVAAAMSAAARRAARATIAPLPESRGFI